MDRGTLWTAVHGITKSQTQLKRLSAHAQTTLAGPKGENPCLENNVDKISG